MDVLQEDRRTISAAMQIRSKSGPLNDVIPSHHRLGATAHRQPFDLREVCPEVVAFESINTEFGRHFDQVRKFVDVAVKESGLEGHPATIAARRSMAVTDLDECPDVV